MSQVILSAIPFGQQQHVTMPLGLSIADIARKIAGTVNGVVAFVRSPAGAKQQWEWVPPHLWHRIKPKGKGCLRLEFYPAGGRGNGQLFATLAAVVVTIAAPYLAGLGTNALIGAGAFLAGSQAAALSTSLLTAGIGLAATFGISKLFGGAQQISAPRSRGEQAAAAFQDLDTDINPLGRDIPPPRIRGYRRVTLPSACNPHRYLENGLDVIEACLIATGHHSLTDIRVGKVGIDSLSGVEYQIRDGQVSTAQQTLIKRVTKTTSVGEEFIKFATRDDSLELVDQDEPQNSEPQEIIVSPGYKEKLSQITLRLNLEPFIYQSSETAAIRVPVRIRVWKKSDPATVYRFREIHIIGRRTSRIPKEIKIRWDDGFGFVGATTDFRYQFWDTVPATADTLSDGSSGTQWQSHSMFSSGGGQMVGTLDGVNVTLDPDVLPPSDLEIGVTVGLPVRDAQFNQSTYALNGTVRSLFRSRLDSGKWKIPVTQDGVFAGASFDWAVMVVNRKPVEVPGIAQIPIRFRGVSAKNVTVKAGAYVYDWGGSAWDDLSVTNNPAAHFRDELRLAQTTTGVSHDLNSDDEFLAWRNECESKGYTVNMICAGQPVNEVLEMIAAAGLATRRFGTGYGIHYHRNRDAEIPECTFSHRDSKISFTRQFAYSPKGAYVDFEDEANEYKQDQEHVNNQWKKTNLPANKKLSFPQVTDRAHVRRLAALDMLQDTYQDVIWTIDTGPAGFNRKRGDMIGMVTDLDTDHAHGFFIRQVTGPRSVAVDRAVAATDLDSLDQIADLSAIADLSIGGVTSVAHILCPDGMDVFTIASVSENVITFTEDLPESWTVTEKVEGSDESVTYPRSALAGTRMSVAARDDLYRKMIVKDVNRQPDGRASIKAFEYRPEISAWLEKYHA